MLFVQEVPKLPEAPEHPDQNRRHFVATEQVLPPHSDKKRAIQGLVEYIPERVGAGCRRVLSLDAKHLLRV